MSVSFRNFILARILLTIPMVLILVTMVFFVMRILPGDPIRSQLGPKVSEAQAEIIRAGWGWIVRCWCSTSSSCGGWCGSTSGTR